MPARKRKTPDNIISADECIKRRPLQPGCVWLFGAGICKALAPEPDRDKNDVRGWPGLLSELHQREVTRHAPLHAKDSKKRIAEATRISRIASLIQAGDSESLVAAAYLLEQRDRQRLGADLRAIAGELKPVPRRKAKDWFLFLNWLKQRVTDANKADLVLTTNYDNLLAEIMQLPVIGPHGRIYRQNAAGEWTFSSYPVLPQRGTVSRQAATGAVVHLHGTVLENSAIQPSLPGSSRDAPQDDALMVLTPGSYERIGDSRASQLLTSLSGASVVVIGMGDGMLDEHLRKRWQQAQGVLWWLESTEVPSFAEKRNAVGLCEQLTIVEYSDRTHALLPKKLLHWAGLPTRAGDECRHSHPPELNL